MRISTVNKIITAWWKIWAVVSIGLSILIIFTQYKLYTNTPEIVKVSAVIESKENNIFWLKEDDIVKFGNRVWKVNDVFSGNDNDYYSITLVDSKPIK